MNKFGRILVILLTLVLFLGHCASLGRIEPYEPYEPEEVIDDPEPIDEPEPYVPYIPYEPMLQEMRGVWVATVLNLDFPSRQDLTPAAIMREIDSIVYTSAQMGLNTIFFQVRPTGDAFYRSEIFPWSHWLTGTQGEGFDDFDPLEYFIEAAHAQDIELHAWINPYRIIHTLTDSSDPETLAENHPVRLNPELAIPWSTDRGDAGLFLDPGLPEARQLILDGIEELVRNFDIDGIHFDDYFYPGTDFDDSVSFARYGNGMELADWRRENVNTLIRDVQSTINDLNEELGTNVSWGVSPSAIWKNEITDPLGVYGTRGMESYHSLFADTRLWVTEGWVDYIMPQIYWFIGFETADFVSVFDWWVDLCRQYHVDLFIGLAAWREVEDEQSPNWQGEILRQLEIIEHCEVANGSVFFRYQFLRSFLGREIRDFYYQHDALYIREPIVNIRSLSLGNVGEDTSVAADTDASVGFNIIGTSDPNEELLMNGEIVYNRTIEGFFSIFVPLAQGDNTFTFTQEGQPTVTGVITRTSPAAAEDPPPAPTIEAKETRTFATVVSDAAWLFPNPTTAGGSNWMLSIDQVDRALAESSNGFIQLSNGMWVDSEQVELTTANVAENALSDGEYHVGTDYDMIVWQSDVFVSVYPTFNGEELIIYFGMHSELPPLELPEDLSETMFMSVRESGEDDDIPFFAFTFREDARYEGHFIDFEDGEFRLHLKKRKALSDGNAPLDGIIIVLDPGHGGESVGAIGPMGGSLTESEIVLTNAFLLADRLTALGATVHLTRETNVDVSLQERVNFSKEHRPDLFISLHADSVEPTTNAANIRGFTVWYTNFISTELSETMLDVLHYINPNTNRDRHIRHANFFVTRPQWAPSVLLEASFMVNIDDFVWLIDPVQQARLADATADAILDYFRG
jgi:uncharacterized lipoprotein YddW (UPF0748 family)/N-acetylmuramoyl-L-alanine amidase